MAIDIGSPATDRPAHLTGDFTEIMVDNPANATGTITQIEIWCYLNTTGIEVGTFYGSGTTYTNRDSAAIESVTSGSKQTFAGLSIDVEVGDYIGWHLTSGAIEGAETGFGGLYDIDGNQMGTGPQTYTFYDGYASSVYGTGTEAIRQHMQPKRFW